MIFHKEFTIDVCLKSLDFTLREKKSIEYHGIFLINIFCLWPCSCILINSVPTAFSYEASLSSLYATEVRG